MTPAARASLADFVTANPRGKHGQVIYDLKGDFGLDPAEVRRPFADYVARFRVRVEN